MLWLDIGYSLLGPPMVCTPLPEPPPVLAQPEKVIAARMARLSAARMDLSVVFMLADRLVVRGAAGRDDDGGEDRQRHQRRPNPFRLCHRDDSADDRVFRFHNFVFLSDC